MKNILYSVKYLLMTLGKYSIYIHIYHFSTDNSDNIYKGKKFTYYNYFLYLFLGRFRETFESTRSRRYIHYYIAYRFFRDVHVKHVRTTSNMMSRQRSAAKCGDGVVVGRLLVSPTRRSTRRTGRAAAFRFRFFFYIYLFISRELFTLFVTRAATTAADASSQKLIGKPLRDRCQRL